MVDLKKIEKSVENVYFSKFKKKIENINIDEIPYA